MLKKPTCGEGCGESVVVVVAVRSEGDDHGVPGGLELVGRERVPAVSAENRLCPRGIHNVLHLKDQWKIYIQMFRAKPAHRHIPDQNFFSVECQLPACQETGLCSLHMSGAGWVPG